MKQLTLILSLALSSLFVSAQKYTSTFEDGKTIDYEIINDKADDLNKINILIGGGAGVSYFLPDVFMAKANITWFGTKGVDGTIFLTSALKPKMKSITLLSKSAGYKSYINYNTKYELQRKTYMGVHVGYSSINYTKDVINTNDLKTNEIALGFGLTRTTNLTYKSYGYPKPKTMTRSKQFNVYADVLIYVGSEIEQKDPSETPSITLDETSAIGFRSYIAGKSGVGKKSDVVGLTYSLGVGISTLKKVYPIASIGLYIGFGK